MLRNSKRRAVEVGATPALGFSAVLCLSIMVGMPSRLEAQIVPEILDAGAGDCTNILFGQSLALSGALAVLGAPRASSKDCRSANEGRVFVYERNASTASWKQLAQIENPGSNGLFGAHVAIHGRTIVASEHYGRTNRPTAYVFEEVGSAWKSVALVVPIQASITACAISDRFIFLGCAEAQPGQVLIYEKPVGGWLSVSSHTHRAALSQPQATAPYFGSDISVSGDRLAVRSVAAQSSRWTGSTAHFYDLVISSWFSSGSFTGLHVVGGWPNGGVDIDGDIAVLGNGSGGVHVLARETSGWKQRDLLSGKSDFGVDVALSRDVATAGRVLVASPTTNVAYVYDPVDPKKLDTWTTRELPSPCTYTGFGRKLAMDGSIAVIPLALSDNHCGPRRLCWAYELGGGYLRGTVTPFGISCPGTGGKRPNHGGTGSPDIGNRFALTVQNTRPLTASWLFIGALKLDAKLDRIGMDGCSLYTAPIINLGVGIDNSGSWSLTLPVPFDRGFVGAKLVTQVIVFDPGAPHSFKLVATNGLVLTIGGHGS